MILTLDIPDALAEQLKTRALVEGANINEFTTAWLQETLAADEAEIVEGIREGLEGLASGSGKSLEESYAGMLELLDKRAASESA
jgi:hypothetical protein